MAPFFLGRNQDAVFPGCPSFQDDIFSRDAAPSDFSVSALIGSAAAEKLVGKDIEKDNQENGEKSAVYKKHESHANRYPEQDEANHSFHGRLLYYHKYYIICANKRANTMENKVSPGKIYSRKISFSFGKLPFSEEKLEKGVFFFGKRGYNKDSII